MRLRLGTLRRWLREAEAPGRYPGRPAARNVLSPATSEREQLGSLAGEPLDTANDPDGVPEHLREPTVDREDCYGPVPPSGREPWVSIDPFTSDYAPQPFSGGGRVKRG